MGHYPLPDFGKKKKTKLARSWLCLIIRSDLGE
jgi:hypothetical protein